MARRLRQESGAGTEITPTLTAALATIERCGPLTPSGLADAEGVQRPTATRIVARLEERGLVSRASDPDDGRVSRVEATSAGRALLKRIRSRKNQYLVKRLRTLDADELATLAEAAEIIERLLAPAGERSEATASGAPATTSSGRAGAAATNERPSTGVQGARGQA